MGRRRLVSLAISLVLGWVLIAAGALAPEVAHADCVANGAPPPNFLIDTNNASTAVNLDTNCPGPPAGNQTLTLLNGVNLTSNSVAGTISENAGAGIWDLSVLGSVTNTNGAGISLIDGGGVVTIGTGAAVSGTSGISTLGSNTLINISGAVTGTGGTAISMGNLDDVVELRPGAVVTGNVLAGGGLGADFLHLGGTGSDSFDVSKVDSGGATQQFQGFEGFLKTGTSTWTLTGTNTALGGFGIVGGQINLNATNITNTVVVVGDGTRLQGNGSVGNLSSLGMAVIAPGNSIGTINVNGVFNPISTLELEVDGFGNSDLINVTGAVDISGSTLDLRSFGDLGSLPIFSAHTVIANDGVDAVTGIFGAGTGLNTAGDLFSTSTTTGGDGNDVVLNLFRTRVTLANGTTNNETIAFPNNFPGIVFDVAGSGSATFGGALSQGATQVGVTKTGAGTLTFAGVNTYTGDTLVTGGRLVNNGSLTSKVIVNNSGTYGGTGIAAGLVANSGATIAPGNSIGTVTINNNVVFNAGSTYQVEIDGTPASDLLNATGTATLNGGAVEVTALTSGASFKEGTVFTILNAAGGVNGTFSSLTDTSAFLDFGLSYGTNSVLLTLTKIAEFGTTAITPNQLASASGLTALGAVGAGDSAKVFNTIALLSEAQSRKAYDASSGEVHASLQQGVLDAADLFGSTLQRRAGLVGGNGGGVAIQVLNFAPNARQTAIPVHALALGEDGRANNGDTIISSWAGALGNRGDYESDGNAAAFDQNSFGFAGGLDVASMWNTMKVTGGIAAGFTDGDANVTARASSADISSWHVGIYGALEDGPLKVSGSMSYAGHNIDTIRSIIFPGINRIATASYNADTFAASAEASWTFALNNDPQSNWTIAPLVKLDLRTGSHNGVTETGAGALNLVVASQSFDRVDGGVGFAVGYKGMVGNWKVTTETRAIWLHAFDDGNLRQSLAFVGAAATPFTVSGVNRGADRMALGFGLNAELSNRVSLNTRYDGSFFGNSANHQGHIALNVGLN